MRKYKDFKEYMEDHYLDMIMERIEPYVVGHKSFFEDEDFYQIDWVDCAGSDKKGINMRLVGMILSLSAALFDCFKISQIQYFSVVFRKTYI